MPNPPGTSLCQASQLKLFRLKEIPLPTGPAMEALRMAYGHAHGDRVLRDLGQALQTQLRDTDILARVGGEEFAIVFTDTGQDGGQEAGCAARSALLPG